MDFHAQPPNDRSRSTNTNRVISIVAVVAVLLSACGGGDDGDDLTADTAPTMAGAVAENLVSAPATTRPLSVSTEPPSRPSTSDDTNTHTTTPHTSTNGGVLVDVAALQTTLDEWRAEVHADGATISIRAPGHADLVLMSGIDGRDPETPMPTDGTFYAASVVKTMVAAVVLRLVNEGRLTLDDTIERWLPEIPSANEITVAMLLDHTAGLPEWYPDILADLARTYTGEEVLHHYIEETPTGSPGERFTYNNANYTAAALLLERELGMSLADIIEQRLATPLGLDDTAIADGSVTPTRHGWFSLNGEPTHPLDNLDFPHQAAVTSLWGAGNLLTSSRDLLTWAHTLYSGELLGEQLTSEMVRMRSPFALTGPDDRYVGTDAPTPLHYGIGTMGFCLDPTGCSPDTVDLVGHGGSIPGSRALIAYHLPSDTTIVVHANTDDIPLRMLARLPADIVNALGAA